MKQLDPMAVWFFFISFVLRWLFVIILFLIAMSGVLVGKNTPNSDGFSFGFLSWLWIIIPLFFIACFVWAKLTYRFYRYELLGNGFRMELGVIYKKYVTIPYDRIQNVDIYRGIVARLLDLSDLDIQTAGTSASMNRYGGMGIGAEGRLPALSREAAEQLRDELIERARHARNQGL